MRMQAASAAGAGSISFMCDADRRVLTQAGVAGSVSTFAGYARGKGTTVPDAPGSVQRDERGFVRAFGYTARG